MPVGFLIGVGSGLASALLFYSAARGAPALGTLLFILTPLPTLLAGLGWGWLPAATGALAGAAVMGVATSWAFATGYALALGLPAALATYLAYLSRPNAHDPSLREWYPAGRLIAALALYAGSLPVMVLPLIGGSYDVLRAPFIDFYRRLSARAAPELGLAPVSEEQISAFAELSIALLPGVLAAYWLAIFTLNLYLAGRIARASGRFGRDWPDLPAMSFPAGFPLVAALALAASFLPGTAGVAGSSFMGALLFAYLLAGLALMHFLARGRAPWILWIVYGALLLFGPYAAFALAMGGILDAALKLKRRFGAHPPTT